MGQFLNMPKLDMSMEEGKLLKWLCAEGDVIAKGDSAFEVETGKVNLEVDSIVEGKILKIYREEGEVVEVNTPVAFVGSEGEEIPELPSKEKIVEEEKAEDIALAKNAQEQIIEPKVESDNKESEIYHVCVIGGGPGGYVAAIKAAQLGGKVALIEGDKLGGTCLNWGCIPTKSLVHHSRTWNNIKNAKEHGFSIKGSSFSWEKIISDKDRVVTSLRQGVSGLLKKNNVDVFKGFGNMLNENTIEVNGEKISAKNIIIATGTKSSEIKINTVGNVKFKDIKDVLSMKELPKRLTIIGGGVIGVEMASILASFDVEVSIVEIMPTILPMLDKDVTELLTSELDKKGVYIKTGTSIVNIEAFKGQYIINLDDKKQIYTDDILLAVGRTPNSESFKGLGISCDSKGYIFVDEHLRTNKPNIYAIGDITNKVQLAHVASHQGIVAAENIFGKDEVMHYDHIPNCVFTDPEIACVGLTEGQCKEKGLPIKVFSFPFLALGKALAINDTRGFVKLIVDERFNEIVGAHIIGPDANLLIAEITAIMDLEGTVDDVTKIIHAHPTLSEAVMESALGILGGAIHL